MTAPDPTWVAALKIGLLSACSLPLGTLTTLVWKPSNQVVGLLMAFGVGALIVAITLDLVHHALVRAHFWQLAAGLVIGGLLFRLLNEIINNKGGFLRKSSTVSAYLGRRRRRRFAQALERLGQIPFFADLPAEALAELAGEVETIDLDKDGTLYRCNDPSDRIYVVEDGTIDLLDPDDPVRVVARFGPGQAFGELAFVAGTARLEDAVAAQDTRIWALREHSLISVSSRSRPLADQLAAFAAGPEVATYLGERHGLTPATIADWAGSAAATLADGRRPASAIEPERHSDAFLAQAHRIRRLPLLEGLPRAELQAFSEILICNRLAPGQILYQQGDAADRMYVIMEGNVTLLDPARPSLHPNTLEAGAALGVQSFLTGAPHTHSAVVVSDTMVWTIRKDDFDASLKRLPVLAARVRDYVRGWDVQQYLERRQGIDPERVSRWAASAARSVDQGGAVPAAAALKHNLHDHSGVALAIWLGVLLDGIPEALVIGASYSAGGHVSASLIAGLILANYPEALSSSVGMRQQGLSFRLVLAMWTSLTLLTGVLAALGASVFAAAPPASLSVLEGIAAGAMLTMIAETMMPEAYSKGGAIVGLATLLGFVLAIFFSTLD